jgi:pimeloyl-ACP methyl ester carboxylesterase
LNRVTSAELPSKVAIPYVGQGDTSGVPLLLLHAFAGSWRSFENVLPRVWKAAGRNRLEEDPAVELGQIMAPTLLIWGDQDQRCPRSELEALLAGIARSRLVVCTGAVHTAHVEEPKRFASDLAAFAQDLAI